jgi:hypothetical protein
MLVWAGAATCGGLRLPPASITKVAGRLGAALVVLEALAFVVSVLETVAVPVSVPEAADPEVLLVLVVVEVGVPELLELLEVLEPPQPARAKPTASAPISAHLLIARRA